MRWVDVHGGLARGTEGVAVACGRGDGGWRCGLRHHNKVVLLLSLLWHSFCSRRNGNFCQPTRASGVGYRPPRATWESRGRHYNLALQPCRGSMLCRPKVAPPALSPTMCRCLHLTYIPARRQHQPALLQQSENGVLHQTQPARARRTHVRRTRADLRLCSRQRLDLAMAGLAHMHIHYSRQWQRYATRPYRPSSRSARPWLVPCFSALCRELSGVSGNRAHH